MLALAVPAFAGTSAKEVVAPAPAPEPCTFTWFTGASIGYLTELEEPMYNFHLGTDTCWNLGGWDVSLFAEIGYAEKDDDWSNKPWVPSGSTEQEFTQPNLIDLEGGDGDLDDLAAALKANAANGWGDTSYDFDIMPITLNVKLERPLTGNLNAYFGGGLGLALADITVDNGPQDYSDDDWVFTAQVFAGVNYNFNPDFEVYGGARWIYFDDADLGGGTLELGDDFLFELGARFNF